MLLGFLDLQSFELPPVLWIKGTVPHGKYYSQGFSENRAVNLQSYTPPSPGTDAVNWDSGHLIWVVETKRCR
ncbi:MAG: hypothetical protein WCO56_28800 [Verrucomicrobiota bacterium]